VGTHNGKVAIITGAGNGIGRGIAHALAKEGASIAIAEIDVEAGERVASEIADIGAPVMMQRCDVRNRDDIVRFVGATVTRFGTVDILVNNAMAATIGPAFEDTSDAAFELAYQTGPYATFVFMRTCHPHLVGGGRVVNVRSGSEVQGLPGHAAYVAAKAAIGGLTRVAAREWGSQGITVNAIFPFALSDSAQRHFDENPEFAAFAFSSLSIARAGEAEKEVGRAVVYLTGPDAGFTTGCTLSVDGGGSFLG